MGRRKHVFGGVGHLRNLASNIEPSVCGGDAACCQITFSSCLVFFTFWSVIFRSCIFSRPNDINVCHCTISSTILVSLVQLKTQERKTMDRKRPKDRSMGPESAETNYVSITSETHVIVIEHKHWHSVGLQRIPPPRQVKVGTASRRYIGLYFSALRRN